MKRFWDKVSISGLDSCWEWRAGLANNRYGQFNFRGYSSMRSHRVAYILTKGEIPGGKVIMHTCDNILCCNPSHLQIGTQQDNLQDMFSKGRDNHPKGVNSKLSALSKDDVEVVKTMYLQEKLSYRKIGIKFNVSHHVISRAIQGAL